MKKGRPVGSPLHLLGTKVLCHLLVVIRQRRIRRYISVHGSTALRQAQDRAHHERVSPLSLISPSRGEKIQALISLYPPLEKGEARARHAVPLR